MELWTNSFLKFKVRNWKRLKASLEIVHGHLISYHGNKNKKAKSYVPSKVPQLTSLCRTADDDAYIVTMYTTELVTSSKRLCKNPSIFLVC